jgi:hypothetical protein
MDLLYWSKNGFWMLFPDLQNLIQYFDLTIICLQETHPLHALNLHDFTVHC